MVPVIYTRIITGFLPKCNWIWNIFSQFADFYYFFRIFSQFPGYKTGLIFPEINRKSLLLKELYKYSTRKGKLIVVGHELAQNSLFIMPQIDYNCI